MAKLVRNPAALRLDERLDVMFAEADATLTTRGSLVRVINSFGPLFPELESISFNFYRASATSPRYVDEAGCEHIGELGVELGEAMRLPLDQREVVVEMKWQEEIVASIRDRMSRVIDNAGRTFAEALYDLAGHVEDLAALLDRDRQRHNELERQVRQVLDQPRVNGEPGATALELLVGRLLQGQRDSETRLTRLSQQRTAERLTSGDYIVHQEIGKRYLNLVNQDLLDAVAGGRNLDPRVEALWRGWLAVSLFMPEYFERGREATYKRLIEKGHPPIEPDDYARIWELAEEIRAAAARSGHPHEWVFEHHQGVLIDPVRQEACGGCDPRGLVEFVVAPGYVVEGERVYAKQIVYTDRVPAAGEQAAGRRDEDQRDEGQREGDRRDEDRREEGQHDAAMAAAGVPAAAGTPSGAHPATGTEQTPMIGAPDTGHGEPPPDAAEPGGTEQARAEGEPTGYGQPEKAGGEEPAGIVRDNRFSNVPRPFIHRYGPDQAQFGELWLPRDSPAGTVVIIHGGFWRARFDLSLGQPLAADLVRRGYAVWNLEYRRVGTRGGWPATFEDVAVGIDLLADLPVDTSRVLAIGHSAGGHLAVWAAGRDKLSAGVPGSGPRVALTAVVSQAGVLALADCAREGVGGSAARDLMGGGPGDLPDLYQLADPIAAVPTRATVHCMHSRADDTVPFGYSERYVKAAVRAGGSAVLHETSGGHYAFIDPAAPDWRMTADALPRLLES